MRRAFPIKTLPDGRAMLNLGCGVRADHGWTNIDFSPVARLARHKSIARVARRVGIISEERWDRLMQVQPDIVIHDLRRGIPFPDGTFDAVYHSHLLEHLDRDLAPAFVANCYRVLKSGGTLRVAVPDLMQLANRYLSATSLLEENGEFASAEYTRVTEDLFDQMVRKEASGTRLQRPLIRAVERFLRGDAAKIGELHRWMYDKYSLGALLSAAGFRDVRTQVLPESRIDAWSEFHLDTNEDGTVYKPGSLYMEGVR